MYALYIFDGNISLMIFKKIQIFRDRRSYNRKQVKKSFFSETRITVFHHMGGRRDWGALGGRKVQE